MNGFTIHTCIKDLLNLYVLYVTYYIASDIRERRETRCVQKN
jgi:hypothetical protein